MKRGFLNNSKAKKVVLAPEGAGNSHPPSGTLQGASGGSIAVRVSHQPVNDSDRPHGYAVGSTFGRSHGTELDGAAINHPVDAMLWTSFPGRNTDLNSHSAAERRDSWTEAIVDGLTKTEIFTQPGFPHPVERPAIPAHRIAPVGGKGLGVFATRDIGPGDLIIAERPLLMVPLGVPTAENIPAHFTMQQMIQASLAEWEKALEILVERMLPERREAFMKLANSHTNDGSGPILGRIRTNGIAASGLHYQGKRGPEGRFSATCELISRANHSCSPNARYTFNKQTFTSRLRAVRDIKAGEEITITYSRLDVPSADRQKDLAPYGFVCTCDACKGGAESDARRAKIPSEISPALKRGRIDQLLDLVALIERENLQDLPVYVDSLMAVVDKYIAQKDFARCQPYLDKVQQYLPLDTDGESA
ncbi:SET domain-containing protein [Schizophyllum commune H4-8]|uniref:SET domain-containing protein n=1 Tax=Schizophyllum commune (strain H4-8 / FGSC 9210) TaxID=578458 RepID=UPI00215F5EB3|nr:SET domain-containing protein [Schizophyllum commune H4-8]KAI5894542.1 SET domain-containing protein [Schizophyllum commune H4-8]